MKKMLVDKKYGDSIKVYVNNLVIGEGNKVIISGPCSVENKDTLGQIVKKLKDIGVNMIRGGVFKPRTSPYDFQGLQYEGLKILKEIKEEYNIPVVTEIMDPRDIEVAQNNVDMIQIGSRNMYNYSLLKEVGKTNIPILLKRGMSATIKEWMYAAEYILSLGNRNVVLCERGIRTFEEYTRNTLDLNSVAYIKNNYRLPIIVDPSHGTGLRELVYPMSLASILAGADGLIIESAIYPDRVLSDSRQTVSIDEVKKIIDKINLINNIT